MLPLNFIPWRWVACPTRFATERQGDKFHPYRSFCIVSLETGSERLDSRGKRSTFVQVLRDSHPIASSNGNLQVKPFAKAYCTRCMCVQPHHNQLYTALAALHSLQRILCIFIRYLVASRAWPARFATEHNCLPPHQGG